MDQGATSRSARTRGGDSILPGAGDDVLASHPTTGPEFTYLEFFEYFQHSPTALAIKECVRLKRMKELPVVGPVLDVGCGDGLFTSLAHPEVDTWGIDVDERVAARAQASHAYRNVICQSVTEDSVALPPNYFSTCIANCSLEHVPDIDAALRNIHRAMRPGGLFYLIVPNGEWTRTLPLRRAFERIGLHDVARAYAAALDAQFAHRHLYEAPKWRELLERAGFTAVESAPLGSDGSQAAFEAWLLPSLQGYITKRMTGRWVLSPALRQLYAWPTFRLVRWLTDRDTGGSGAELLIVCRAGAT